MSSKDIYTELNAFMDRMRDGETHEIVANLQAAIEYQAEKLRIYEEKYMEATGKEWPEKTDDDCRPLTILPAIRRFYCGPHPAQLTWDFTMNAQEAITCTKAATRRHGF